MWLWKRRLPAPLAAAALAACASYQVTPSRVGALYQSEGDACEVRFENLGWQEASASHQHLGLVTISGAPSSEFTDFQFVVWRGK